MSLSPLQIKNIIEAAIMAVSQPVTIERIMALFGEDEAISKEEIKAALEDLATDCAERGVELKEVRSGYRFQAKQDYSKWLVHLWEEKPPKYSRALLETLVLIAYRQPITRGEIEDVRGVSVSSHIIKTLMERDWVRVVGHRDVPGKPGLYATTKEFLDYFNLRSLDELPPLSEIKDLDKINVELALNEQAGEIVGQLPEAQDQQEQPVEDVEAALVEDLITGSSDQEQNLPSSIAEAEEDVIGEDAIDVRKSDDASLSRQFAEINNFVDEVEAAEAMAESATRNFTSIIEQELDEESIPLESDEPIAGHEELSDFLVKDDLSDHTPPDTPPVQDPDDVEINDESAQAFSEVEIPEEETISGLGQEAEIDDDLISSDIIIIDDDDTELDLTDQSDEKQTAEQDASR